MPDKKRKLNDESAIELEGDAPSALSWKPLPGLRTAFEVHKAVEKYEELGRIGTFPLENQVPAPPGKGEWDEDLDDDSGDEPSDDENDMDYRKHVKSIVTKLQDLNLRHGPTHVNGTLESYFSVNITINCGDYHFQQRLSKNEGKSAEEDRLRAWFENASVSGYGDVRALETKIDSSVRNAREILAPQFSVDKALLKTVKSTWANNFYPTKVRIEPYKIHIYGAGGHFKPHRDTPEKDLVGTFLVGLGDSTGSSHFEIGGKKLSARMGSFCAFYPDVPHAVTPIEKGHRAVIAFKVFRDGVDPHPNGTADDRRTLHDNLSQLKPPFGLLFGRDYYMGTTELSGFDDLLLSAAREQSNFHAELLPVLIQHVRTAKYDGYNDDERVRVKTHVYPFSSAHIDYLVKGEQSTADGQGEALRKRLEKYSDIPFYALDFEKSAAMWSQDTEELNHTGNEADGTREDSVYVSYALLALPNQDDEATVEKDNETEESDEEE